MKSSNVKINEREKQFEEPYGESGDAVFVYVNGLLTDCNEATLTMFNYKSKEAVLKTPSSKMSPKLQPDGASSFEEQEEMIKIALEKGTHRYDWVYTRSNGDDFPVEVLLMSISNESNHKVIYSVIKDVTDQSQEKESIKKLIKHIKELEISNIALEKSKSARLIIMQEAKVQKERAENIHAQLKASTGELKKLTHAVEQSFATIVITDRIGKIEYVNAAFTKSTGCLPDEIIGKTLHLLKYNQHTSQFYENIWQTILDGKTWRRDIIFKKKSGEEYWQSVSVSPIHNEKDEITHFVAVKEDITERKKMEEKLLDSKNKADKANQAKSSFLANMSHEIRTPMNAIIGFSDILANQIKEPSQLQYLNSIQSSGKILLTLINDILDLSKIESGKIDIHYKPTNIKLLIQEVINILKVHAEEKGLHINMVISEDFPNTLVIDELRVKQIIINLLNNAIKFTEQGFIEIEVTAKNTSTYHLDLILKIKDTGIGISKPDQLNIFNAFKQVDMRDNKKYEGTGLGLTITQQLLKLMNGTIGLTSKKGKGSLFTVFLEKVKISKEEEAIEEEIDFDAVSIQFKKSTILIVDDNINNLELIKEYLSNYNFNIIAAVNGQEALMAFGEHNPDLVFLDLKMPIMDGFEVNNAIKKNSDWSHIPVIAITSSVYSNDKEKAISDGFISFIEKPVSRKEILKTLLKYVNHTIVITGIESVDEVIHEPIEKLEELILEVEDKVMPIYEDLLKIRQKKTVLVLANQLKETGKKFKSAYIINYGEELQSACESFNIPKERKLIKQFLFYIKDLHSPVNDE
tara:strand:- start:15952 stop:18363 length:2412 start_codon:yes stop_codon:yes gene_type:complete